MAKTPIVFGPFVLDLDRGKLLREGSSVAIGHRGFVLLRALLDADGETVPKQRLIDAAWPNASIEESNLTVQIAALRRTLGTSPDGDEWIATVPRVGYRLLRSQSAEIGSATMKRPVETLAAPDGRPSIAVLPFNNMSSDPEQDYFADGMSEDLITDLSKVPGLLVIARNSSFAYKGRQVDLRQIARELGVRYIVEGSVRRAADRVRINAQLIDTIDNGHLWADRFDRSLSDIFELQDEVVGRILNALAHALPSARPLSKRHGTNLEAYDLFVHGRVLVTRLAEGNRAARPILERSIELDPLFAEAHAWLAVSHHFAWAYWGEQMEPHRSLARAVAERAVFLDAENAVARGILGDVLIYDSAPEEGAAQLEAALRVNPSHADAWTFWGQLKAFEGSAPDGIELIQKALRLNPHPPGWYYWLLGLAQYAATRYDDAIRTLRHESTYRMGSQRILAASLAQVGRLDEAHAEAQQFLTANPHFSMGYWAKTQPFRFESDRQHFIDGYLKAGLPRS